MSALWLPIPNLNIHSIVHKCINNFVFKHQSSVCTTIILLHAKITAIPTIPTIE
jgi:hypothetical protein